MVHAREKQMIYYSNSKLFTTFANQKKNRVSVHGKQSIDKET